MTTKQLSFGIVIAALAVSAPRLTLAFLIGDGIHIPEHIEIAILTVTGVGSGIVLTVGNAVLAHALASKAHQRSALWTINAVAWCLFLVGAVVLVAPTLVVGLRRSSLADVLTSGGSQWFWAVTAVVIVELLVGAAMAASILADEQQPLTTKRRSSRWGKLLDAAADRLSDQIRNEPSVAYATPLPTSYIENPPPHSSESTKSNGSATTLDAANQTRARTKAEAIQRTIELFRVNPHASLAEVGESIGRDKSTIKGYLDELELAGLIYRNGRGVEVLG